MGDLGPSAIESPLLAAVHSAWETLRMNVDETPSLATFDGQSWCQEVPLNLIIVLVLDWQHVFLCKLMKL